MGEREQLFEVRDAARARVSSAISAGKAPRHEVIAHHQKFRGEHLVATKSPVNNHHSPSRRPTSHMQWRQTEEES